jgi:hypothetical protein
MNMNVAVMQYKGEYEAWRQPEMLTAALHPSRIFSAGIYLRVLGDCRY